MITKDIKIGVFLSSEDVPPSLKEFYVEREIIVSYETLHAEHRDTETGEVYTMPFESPIYGIKIEKLPAYYEDGGYISRSSATAWDFHDNYLKWMIDQPDSDSSQFYVTDENDLKVFNESLFNDVFALWNDSEPQR